MEFIAHRAGNDLSSLQAAIGLADRVEFDVHLGPGGRVEARHAKLLWPTSRLWDRWYVLPPSTAVPALATLLGSIDDQHPVWLDLKGCTRRLSRHVLAELGSSERDVIVSTKPWWLLPTFTGRSNTRVIRSAGNRTELALLLMLPSMVSLDGVVVAHRLLTDKVVRRLLRRFETLYTWGLDDIGAVERLGRLGATGVILDDLSLIAASRLLAEQGNGFGDLGGHSQAQQ